MDPTKINDNALDFLINESSIVVTDPAVETLNAKDAHNVPGHMHLTNHLRDAAPKLYDGPLLEISFGNSVDNIEASRVTSFRDVLGKVDGSRPTVCLVLRRPGCCFCREDGAELSKLAETEDINLIATVKDVRDQEGLHVFHKYYFPYPTYQDVDLNVYEGLGNRKIGLKNMLYSLPKGYARTSKKKIRLNMKGWFDTIQGGVLIFDCQGELRYCYREQYADELQIQDIQAAIQAVRSQ